MLLLKTRVFVAMSLILLTAQVSLAQTPAADQPTVDAFLERMASALLDTAHPVSLVIAQPDFGFNFRKQSQPAIDPELRMKLALTVHPFLVTKVVAGEAPPRTIMVKAAPYGVETKGQETLVKPYFGEDAVWLMAIVPANPCPVPGFDPKACFQLYDDYSAIQVDWSKSKLPAVNNPLYEDIMKWRKATRAPKTDKEPVLTKGFVSDLTALHTRAKKHRKSFAARKKDSNQPSEQDEDGLGTAEGRHLRNILQKRVNETPETKN